MIFSTFLLPLLSGQDRHIRIPGLSRKYACVIDLPDGIGVKHPYYATSARKTLVFRTFSAN